MKTPTLEELAIQPEPLAVERHFDAKNYRLVRWVMGFGAILSLAGIGSALQGSRYALLFLSGINLAAILAFFALRREPFFAKSFRQILLAFLLLQVAVIKVASPVGGDAPVFFVLFMILL